MAVLSAGDIKSPITTVEELQRHLQVALGVEFATIPLYLTALYSLKDKSSQAYHLIRTVAMEEMSHLYLASNLLTAAGGDPDLVGRVPKFPQKLVEHANRPYLQLMVASTTLMRELFMAIEQPATPDARPQAGGFSTIGQLYMAIEEGFEKCDADPAQKAKMYLRPERQQSGWNFGNYGATDVKVVDLKSAKEAIRQIVEQGEGVVTASEYDRSRQPWAAYQYYGIRADRTYGPILGAPTELSHYYKFKDIADGVVPLGETYPMQANPSVAAFAGNDLAVKVATIFNGCYGLMIRALQQALRTDNRDPHAPKDLFFIAVLPMMRSLGSLGLALLNIPLSKDGDADLGPTAGPTWQYDSSTIPAVQSKVNGLIAEITEKARGNRPLTSLLDTLRSTAATLADVISLVEG